MVEVMERHQIGIYLGALAIGAGVGVLLPGTSGPLELAIYPVLGTLLYATFLQVPFTRLAAAFRDVRFLLTVLVLNFMVVPLVVAALIGWVSLPQAVLLGVLLTLLTPCIDYVIVFTGLGGGDHHRLLAASPLLMLVQLLVLPLWLWIFVGPELADIVEPRPFLEAFGLLIALPLGLAWLTEAVAARHRAGRLVARRLTQALVPLMAATLFVVVASQVPKLDNGLEHVATVIPLYAGFLAIMAVIGVIAARVARLGTGASRALVFSGGTRNSLVVLPLALALPDEYAITATIVVTQTFVELAGMLVYIRLVPRLVPSGRTGS